MRMLQISILSACNELSIRGSVVFPNQTNTSRKEYLLATGSLRSYQI